MSLTIKNWLYVGSVTVTDRGIHTQFNIRTSFLSLCSLLHSCILLQQNDFVLIYGVNLIDVLIYELQSI